MITCPDCEGEGKSYLSCCGHEMDHDILICPECKEHWEPEPCETCKGTGQVEDLGSIQSTVDPDQKMTFNEWMEYVYSLVRKTKNQ